MAGTNRIRGIYLAIELDTASIKKQVSSLVTNLSSEFRALGRQLSIAPDLNTAVVEKSFANIATSAAYLKKELQAVSDVKSLSGLINDTSKLNNEFEALAKLIPIDQKELRKLFDTATQNNAAKGLANAFVSMAKSMNLSGKEAVDLAKKMGITGTALEMIRGRVDRTSKSFLEQVKNLMTTGNAMAALQSTLATLGANISLAGMVELGKAAVDTTVRITSLDTAYKSIYHTQDLASKELEFIRKTTHELGLEYYSTAEAAKGFFAAAQTTNLKNQAEEIFRAFSEASSALKLSQEDTNGVFLAISQMLSKGKISAEELRQQLGERLPGAVQMLAKAMGKTTGELDKMMQDGKVGLENLLLLAKEVSRTYGAAATEAGNALLGQMNRLSTAWIDFKASLFDSETIANMFRMLTEAVKWLTEHSEQLVTVIKAVGGALAGLFVARMLSNVFIMVKTSVEAFSNSLVLTAVRLGEVKEIFTVLRAAFVAHPFGILTAALMAAGAAFGVFGNFLRANTIAIDDYSSQVNKAADSQQRLNEEMKRGVNESIAEYSARLRSQTTALKDQLEEQLKAIGNFRARLALEAASIKFGGLEEEEVTKTRTSLISLIASFQEGRISSNEFRDKLVALAESLKDNTGHISKNRSNMYDMIMSLNKAAAATDETTDKIAKNTKELSSMESGLYGVAIAANEAGNEIRNAFNVDFSSIDKVIAKAEKNLAFSGATAKYKGTLGSFLTQGSDGRYSDAQQKILDNIGTLEKIALSTKNYNTGSSAVFDKIEELTGLRGDEGLLAISKDIASQAYAEKKNKEYRDSLKKGKSGSKSSTNKVEAAKLGMDSFKTELEQLQEQNLNATDSFAYAWSGTNKYIVEADKNIQKFVGKYKSVVSEADLQEAKANIMLLAQEKQSAAQEKLLREWLSKSNSALDEYYERHGLVNERELSDFKKQCDEQVAALTQMNQTKLISEEEYLKALKDLEERYGKGNISQSDYESQKDELNRKKNTPIVGDEEATLRIKAINEAYAEMAAKQKAIEEGSPFGNIERGAKQAFMKIKESCLDLTKVGADLTNTFFNGFSSAFANVITGSQTAKEAFSDMAKSMLKQLAQILMQMMMIKAIQSSGFFGAADGAVIGGGALSNYSNGVYASPTFFNMGGNSTAGMKRFANGGVFGEAGPEAIMPLTRMSNGRLGVAASGSAGSGDVKVNVYNYGNEKASVQSSTSSTGGKSIDIIIGDMVAKQMATPGTRLNRVVSSQTGTQSPVSRR